MFVTETTIKSCLLQKLLINHVCYRNYYEIMFVTETTMKSCLLQKLL